MKCPNCDSDLEIIDENGKTIFECEVCGYREVR